MTGQDSNVTRAELPTLTLPWLSPDASRSTKTTFEAGDGVRAGIVGTSVGVSVCCAVGAGGGSMAQAVRRRARKASARRQRHIRPVLSPLCGILP
jgi:hypothetical protein